MSVFDIVNLIPQDLQREIVDSLVDFVSKQAEKLVGQQASDKIKKLKSDAAFEHAFQIGLQHAAERFVCEYEVEDEDLVAGITADRGLFQNEQVQQALLAMIKKPGVYLADERETVLQSFETVLPKRKNRERVDRAVTVFLKYLAEELWTLPKLQGIYTVQFQRMTAEAVRQQIELQKAQLQATVGLGTDIQQALLQLRDVIAQQELLPSSEQPALPPPPRVYHNLPHPDYETFIGREKELAQVRRILQPYPHSQTHLVTIDGIGGIGKSALALEVAHHYLRDYDHLPLEERFEAIIWASAKSSVLTANGISSRRQITRTLEDIYTTIAITLEREDITQARPDEKDDLVTRALTQQRTLLIVDNLETVDDERVNDFLRELPAPTKAIVTTRHRINVAYPVRLTGMPEEDGLALIDQECHKKGVTLTRSEAEKLYERTGGVPLAIVWGAAQMGYGYGVEAVLRRLGHPSDDIARFCFEGTVDRIRDTDAHKLLMALSLFTTDASREALGYVAGLDEDVLSRDEGLVTLERLSLVTKQADRFSSLPLTRSYVAHELEQHPDFEQPAFERLVTYYKQLITPPQEFRVGIAYWDGLANYARAESLEREWENLNFVIRRSLDDHCYTAALDLFLPIVHLLHIWGLWDARLALSHQLCQAAHELDDLVEAWLWIDAISYIQIKRQQFSECFQALKTGRALARQCDIPDAVILADTLEAVAYLSEGDTDLARSKIEPILEQIDADSVPERDTPLRRIVARRVISAAAWVSQAVGDLARAKRLYERTLELRQLVGEDPTPGLSNLALVSLQLGDILSAERYFSQTLSSPGAKHRAWRDYEMAAIAERKGEFKEAERFCRLALEQFIRLDMKRGIQYCEELLTRLQEHEAAQ